MSIGAKRLSAALDNSNAALVDKESLVRELLNQTAKVDPRMPSSIDLRDDAVLPNVMLVPDLTIGRSAENLPAKETTSEAEFQSAEWTAETARLLESETAAQPESAGYVGASYATGSQNAAEVMVNKTNDAPVATTAPETQVIQQGTALKLTLLVEALTDADSGDQLALSATLADGSPLPAWLSFDPATGTFSGTPTNADVGTLALQVTATDGSGATVAQSFTLTIDNTNDAPVAAMAIGSQSAAEDAAFTFVVPAGTFVDADSGDQLALSATLADGSPLPAWLSFDPATGTFSGTPTNADVGTLALQVTATDGSGATVAQSFTLTIDNTNDAPVAAMAIGSQSAAEDAAFTFAVPAGTFVDADTGDQLALSATLADGSPLPAWLSFDPATGTFSGTPTNADVGTLALQVTATDGSGATVAQGFTLTIDNTNDAPVAAMAIGSQSAAEDAAFTFVVPAGTFVDADSGDQLALSATLADGSPLPAWLSFDPATGTFSGTPTNADVGTLALQVTATDGSGATVAQSFTLTIDNTNDAPVAAMAIGSQSAAEDSAFTFAVPAGTFVDADSGDQLALSATLADGSPLPAWLSFDPATGTFSGTPTNADVGTLALQVTATDGSGATVAQGFTLTIDNTNDAPVAAMAIGSQSAAEDAAFTFAVPAGTFTDADSGDQLALSATLADGSPLPAWLSFDPATGTFSGTPTNADVGTLALQVTATDGSGATVAQGFTLTIGNTNDAPVAAMAIGSQSAAEDAAFTFVVPAGTFVDADSGDQLALSATLADGSPLPAWLSFDPATGTFSGTPTNADVGTLALQVTATDGSGATVAQSFTLTIDNTNDAPVAAMAIGSQSAAEDSAFTFAVPAGTFVDADSGDQLALSATLADGSPLPAWLSFDPATGTFSGTPTNADVGTLALQVTATDGSGATVAQGFTLTIDNTNDAPVAAMALETQFIQDGTAFKFALPVDAFTDADAGDQLALSATLADGSPLPDWLSFDPATGTFSGVSKVENSEKFSVLITATDAQGASTTQSFTLVIEDSAEPPSDGDATSFYGEVIGFSELMNNAYEAFTAVDDDQFVDAAMEIMLKFESQLLELAYQEGGAKQLEALIDDVSRAIQSITDVDVSDAIDTVFQPVDENMLESLQLFAKADGGSEALKVVFEYDQKLVSMAVGDESSDSVNAFAKSADEVTTKYIDNVFVNNGFDKTDADTSSHTTVSHVTDFSNLMDNAYHTFSEILEDQQAVEVALYTVLKFEANLLELSQTDYDAKDIENLVEQTSKELQSITKVDVSEAVDSLLSPVDEDMLDALSRFSSAEGGEEALKEIIAYDNKFVDQIEGSGASQEQLNDLLKEIDLVTDQHIGRISDENKFDEAPDQKSGSAGYKAAQANEAQLYMAEANGDTLYAEAAHSRGWVDMLDQTHLSAGGGEEISPIEWTNSVEAEGISNNHRSIDMSKDAQDHVLPADATTVAFLEIEQAKW